MTRRNTHLWLNRGGERAFLFRFGAPASNREALLYLLTPPISEMERAAPGRFLPGTQECPVWSRRRK